MLKKGDIILVLIIVFGISLGIILKSGNNSDSLQSWNNVNSSEKEDVYAIIEANNEIIKIINLSKLKEREVTIISGKYNTMIVADHKQICFMSTNCIDKLCVKEGWLSKPGQVAICLSNKSLIRVVNAKDKALEGVEK